MPVTWMLADHVRNVMLVVCSKPVKEVLASFDAECVGVLREVAVLKHVVNVIPNSLQMYTKFAVVVHYLFGLAPVLIALRPESVNYF